MKNTDKTNEISLILLKVIEDFNKKWKSHEELNHGIFNHAIDIILLLREKENEDQIKLPYEEYKTS